MRQVFRSSIVVLSLVSLAAGANIDGKIVGWSGTLPSPQHPAVVWVAGIQNEATSKTEPAMAQSGGQFAPSFLIVVAGQTVRMPNQDDVAHNVYSLSPTKKFDLGYYAKGDVRTVTFDRPGVVEVRCVIHSFMRARILVVPNPYYSTVAVDGSFRIRNVPAGTYTLTFWDERMGTFSQQITVPEGGKPLTLSVSWPQS